MHFDLEDELDAAPDMRTNLDDETYIVGKDVQDRVEFLNVARKKKL